MFQFKVIAPPNAGTEKVGIQGDQRRLIIRMVDPLANPAVLALDNHVLNCLDDQKRRR
jgi:hypothetical protein